jgi:hypothetical protein
MDPRRFDRLARRVAARRLSRRTTLTASGGGVAAALLGAFGGRRALTASQDATPGTSPIASPVASPGATLVGDGGPEFLFVQTFAGGTWAPKPDADGVYLLTLTGHAAQTVYFSDRPERLVGTIPTRDFLDRLGFTPADPPNAAVVAQTSDGGEDVLVVELFDPVYAEGFGEGGGVTVTYTARVLIGESGPRLTPLAARQDDDRLPAAFGPATLFIDGPCLGQDQECFNAKACCAGLACHYTAGFGQPRCCAYPGAPCPTGNECCSVFPIACLNGTCCGDVGGPCGPSFPCCPSLTCENTRCANTAGGRRPAVRR